MSPSATSFTPIADRVPRWSSTGHASARAALLSTPHSSQRAIVMGAQAMSSGPPSRRNHPITTLPCLAHTPIAAVKSP
jgi:hypothetical protein